MVKVLMYFEHRLERMAADLVAAKPRALLSVMLSVFPSSMREWPVPCLQLKGPFSRSLVPPSIPPAVRLSTFSAISLAFAAKQGKAYLVCINHKRRA